MGRRWPTGAAAGASRVATSVLALALLAGASCASTPPGLSSAQTARYRELARAIEARRSFEVHCWCEAYRGGLCGVAAARALGLSAADIPVLRALGRTDDYQIAAGVADMLATLGAPARADLVALIGRPDEVGNVLRIGVAPDGGLGHFEECAAVKQAF